MVIVFKISLLVPVLRNVTFSNGSIIIGTANYTPTVIHGLCCHNYVVDYKT